MAGDKAGDTTDLPDLTDTTPPRERQERPYKIRKTHGDIHGLLHGDIHGETHVDSRARDYREDIREAAAVERNESEGLRHRNRIPSSEASEVLSNQNREDHREDHREEREGVPNSSGTTTPPKRSRDMDQKIS